MPRPWINPDRSPTWWRGSSGRSSHPGAWRVLAEAGGRHMSVTRKVQAMSRMAVGLCALFAVLGATQARAGEWVHGVYSNAWGTRSFQLWVPTGYQPGEPLPLVVGLHGCLQNPDQFAGLSRLNEKADAERFL